MKAFCNHTCKRANPPLYSRSNTVSELLCCPQAASKGSIYNTQGFNKHQSATKDALGQALKLQGANCKAGVRAQGYLCCTMLNCDAFLFSNSKWRIMQHVRLVRRLHICTLSTVAICYSSVLCFVSYYCHHCTVLAQASTMVGQGWVVHTRHHAK